MLTMSELIMFTKSVHVDSLTANSYEETFLHGFSSNSEVSTSELLENRE